MNKIAILASVSMLCAGCAPAAKPITPAPVVTMSKTAVATPPKAGVVDMPAPSLAVVAYPENAIVRQKPLSKIEVYPGSLKENIDRIAAHYGWHQVVWDAPQDYTWVGHAQIQAENLPGVLRQLLSDYPLQAVFYQGNHVVYIHPRTLK